MRVTCLAPAAAERLAARATVLDTRDDQAFADGHLAGAGHVPHGDFETRRAELPPREAELLVIAADGARAAAAADDLAARGFTRVAFLDGLPQSLAAGLDDRGPAARLWRPAPFLEAVLPDVLAGLDADPAQAPGVAHPAADLAAGAGRDAAFLAAHGFAVEAWDVDPEALTRAAALAARAGVHVQTIVCDLERPDPPLAAERYALVVSFRFLHRPLFPVLARALAPGGWLVIETYRRGQERFGRPRRPRFLLEDGELARAFPTLETLRYEEPEPAGGPVTARLLARRPLD